MSLFKGAFGTQSGEPNPPNNETGQESPFSIVPQEPVLEKEAPPQATIPELPNGGTQSSQQGVVGTLAPSGFAFVSPAAKTEPVKLQIPEITAETRETMQATYNNLMQRLADIVFEINLPENQVDERIQKLIKERDAIRALVNRMLAVLKLGLPYGKTPAVQELKEHLDKKILAAAYQTKPDKLESAIREFSRELDLFQEILAINEEIEELSGQ